MSGSDPLPAAVAGGPISDEAMARAQSLLTPAQIATLRQIQSEHKSQAEAMRSLLQADPDAAKPAPAPQSAAKRPSATR